MTQQKTKTWFLGDPHLNHSLIWPMRGFKCSDEHDEKILENHNSVVGPNDIVYWLGDIMLNVRDFNILRRFNGRIRCVLGNHDTAHKIQEYNKFFEVCMAYHTMHNVIVSHIPVHPRELAERFICNIHAHLHTNIVMDAKDIAPDPKYICVSAEQINLTPISYDEIHEMMKKRGLLKK